ncbi:MAG TPA: MFS transporter [candidate division Zixibacteria bacterium]|nr:MFS transporter [candidate division Zixibacteria bacterium]
MRQALGTALGALRRVLGSADVRRAALAWMGGWASEFGWQVALFVYAFAIGGVLAVGAMGLVRMLPAAFLAPMLTSFSDRLPRHRVLLGVYVGRATLVGLAALHVVSGWPLIIIFAIALAEGLLAVLHRPTYMALVPALARDPEELVATNLASSTLEAVGTLIGPALVGVLVAVAPPWAAFVAAATGFTLSAVSISGVRPTELKRTAPERTVVLRILAGGLAILGRYPHAALVVGLLGLQTMVRGLLSVLVVVTAVELLAIGEEGVGYLTAGLGAGGLLGAVLSMGLVSRRRMAPFVYLGLALWGLPIMVMGAVPVLATALLGMTVVGAANAVLDIAAFSLLQRSVPNAARGRVFGIVEAAASLGVGLGAALAPVLVSGLGAQWALVVTGLLLPLAASLAWRWLRSADERSVIPEAELRLLRSSPIFRPLPLTVLEQLADDLVMYRFEPGQTIIREGEPGDRFYLLAEGRAAVTVGDEEVRRMEAGDSFGEIALLKEVPRTATVTALEPTIACALSRDEFLAAVTGDRYSRAAAEDVMRERLAVSG